MDSTEERLSRLARTMDDINQLELEEMARGVGPRQVADNQLHLNMLKRRIQQQRGIVSKLSRDDLENQYLHALEELEMLKKEGNTKDIYIKKLSTKILRLQRNENIFRDDQRGFSASLRTEMEQKIRSLENQLRMAKVYGSSSLPRRGSKTSVEPSLTTSQLDTLRQQIQALETEKRDEQEAHRRTAREMQAEIVRVTEKISNDNARTTMLENIEITRLTRQLAKTSQDLLQMKNDYVDMRPKYEELQINKIVITRENERLKQEIERHQQTIENIDRDLREAREKSLQQIHDHERANRLETELDWVKRQQNRGFHTDSTSDPSGRATEGVLRAQIKTVEEEMQKESRECLELRKRVAERELDIEKALRDISELRSVNLKMKQECEDLRSKYDEAIRSEPRKSDRWFQAPTGMKEPEIEEALRLHEAFRHRRNMGVSTDEQSPSEVIVYRPDPILQDELTHSRTEREKLVRDLQTARDKVRSLDDEVERLRDDRDQLIRQMEDSRESGTLSQATAVEIKELKRSLQEKTRQLAQQDRFVEDLERQLKDVADGVVVYNLEDDVADQSRLSAENVVLQHGDNLLQLHFGPFSFNEEFFVQARALKIKKWRLKWSVFGENEFAQDSDQTRPDFDFTAIHCITMDEDIMNDLAEGHIRVEIVGIRNDFSRAFTFASFSCRKLLEDSYQRLNRIRGEVPLTSQFNVGSQFGMMAYWIRMKFDIRQTQAIFLARRKALEYAEDNNDTQNGRPTTNQIWMREDPGNRNLLHIRIKNCRGIRALTGRDPPSPCVLYQFYNAKMTYTPTVTGTENPHFDHSATFRIIMNDPGLLPYLQSQKLDIYVTDTNDHNKDHFLGYCRVTLADLSYDTSPEKLTLPLLTQDSRQNGTISLSFAWERPFSLNDIENYPRSRPLLQFPVNGRGNRVSMTPRGSLLSVRHTPKLLKVEGPPAKLTNGATRTSSTTAKRNLNLDMKRDEVKVKQSVGEEYKPKAPPRKSISGPGGRPSDVQHGPNGNLTDRSSTGRVSSNDYRNSDQRRRPNPPVGTDTSRDRERLESPLSSQRRRSRTVDDRRTGQNSDPHEFRSVDRDQVSPRYPRSRALSLQQNPARISENISSRVMSPESGRKGRLERHLSENGSSFLRKLTRSGSGQKSRRATVGDPVPSANSTIQAEMHATGSPKEKRTTPFRTFLSGLGRQNSGLKNGIGDGRTSTPVNNGSLSQSPKEAIPPDSIQIIVHSLYFIPNSRILSDPRPGEIFVIFELFGEEHESPLAVVKPNVPNKELIFEFEKAFSVDSLRNQERRRVLADMLGQVPPGRISFSVYFQPDDESMDSELVGVAALSLNRLLAKNQDALMAELKLISPTEPAVAIGYLKVTVRAVAVLLEIQRNA